MTDGLKVLIVGGYGVFGGRIVELLEGDLRLTLFVGGRSVARANAFVRSRGNTGAQLTPVAFDRDGDVAAQLSAIGPDMVVDASGPFQAYGDDRYRVVQACLARGVNYLDLADGSDFVAGIGAYDDQAKAAGIYVLAGVSSFPVLTAADRSPIVGRHDGNQGHHRGGIAPSPYAGVGENVVRAIAGYAGKPIRRKRDGVFCTGYPLTEQLRYTIAPPGYLPLDNKMFSLVDVPDLHALAALWPEAEQDLDGSGSGTRTVASFSNRVGVARALASVAHPFAARALDAFCDQPHSLGRTSRRHVCRGLRCGCVRRASQAELASHRRRR